MPSKYVIHTAPVPNRFRTITKSGVIAWEEGCLRCAVCVKTLCVYQVYENRGLDPRQMIDSIDDQCMNCFRCIQSCPKGLIHKSMNPEYRNLGDSHWTPDIISRLWYQAETGKIPVSGAGYPGPFSGPGFDAMWTDMSEIVRPTRDGIHGREYISTAIDLGPAPRHLLFDGDGGLQEEPNLRSIPVPFILRIPPFGAFSEDTVKGWAMAARDLGIYLALPEDWIREALDPFHSVLIPVRTSDDADSAGQMGKAPMVEVPFNEGRDYPDAGRGGEAAPMMIVRVPMTGDAAAQALSLVEAGTAVIHLEADSQGRMMDDPSKPIRQAIAQVHGTLVDAGLRDQVTLLGSGGFAMPEYVAKGMICGLDGVMVDFPALIALECRMCRRCTQGLPCPVDVDAAPSDWVASRIVNLLGAWHNQLLEVMGAMGIRDARRLRGEAGRAMFFDELDEATFGNLARFEEGMTLE